MATSSPDPFGLIFSGRVHIAGGLPRTIPDVPVSAVFLLFYIAGAIANVAMFLRYGKRFRWQMMLFGYCMARNTTLVLRIAWSQRLANGNLAIASLVFLNAGVLIIFVLNLQMTKKTIFRTHYAYFKANRSKKMLIKKAFTAISILLLAFLALTIVGAVQGFLSLNNQKVDAKLKKIGITAFLVYSCLPFPILAINAAFRLKYGKSTATKNGQGAIDYGRKSWEEDGAVWKNSAIILVSATLVIFEYAVKIPQTYGDAAVYRWYYSKGAFYGTGLLPELLAGAILLLSNMPVRYSGYYRGSDIDGHSSSSAFDREALPDGTKPREK